MLSARKLEEINLFMVGRGSPDKLDNKGYNVSDYNKLSTIWNGASIADLYEISSRLLKYYDTQLKASFSFTKEELEKTIEYYKEKKKKIINKPSVTVEYVTENDYSIVSFKYNADFINTMRKFGYSFTKENKYWVGPYKTLIKLLNELGKKGADIENALLYVKEQLGDESISFEEEINEAIEGKEDEKTLPILNVEKIDENHISLTFDYNDALINEIKNLRFRKFDWKRKAWIIQNFEVRVLYENILHMNYDLSMLKPYLEKSYIPKVKLIKVKDYDVEFSFPYIQEVIDRIKELTYYRFNRPNTSWIIDIRELHILLKRLDGVIDTEELKQVEIPEESKGSAGLKDYSYLSRKPYKHQVEAAKFLLEKKKCVIAHEMGSGKSLTGILAAFTLNPKRLVICPASLKYNWEKEIKMVDYNGSTSVIGDKADYSSDWIIINYDILEREYRNLMKINFTSVILDEAHYIKSVSNNGEPMSKRAKYTIKLTNKIEYIFSLTGTPITNKPKDIFNILKVCNHILSRNFFSFAKKYCGARHNGFGWEFNSSSNEEELHKYLKSVMDRKRKEEMLDLPDKIRRFIPVEINFQSYNKAVEEYKREKSGIKTKGEHLAYLTTIKHILAKEKVQNTIELAENILSTGESVVIFTNYNEVIDRLMVKFKNKATKITGACNAKDRQKAVDDFQSGKKTVMVANIIAAGVGITLVKANNLIFNDFDWVPSNHFQAEDRIHRIGQSKKCVINYVYANGAKIDEYIANMLETKSSCINEIIDGGKGDQLDIQAELIKILFQTT